MDQGPVLLVFLDLKKSYDTIDRRRLLKTLEGYSSGRCMCRLLSVYWVQQEFVTLKNVYQGLHFKATQGTTQGRLILHTLFNLIVENLARNWLAMVVEIQLVTYEGLGINVGICLVLFYTYDGVAGLQYLEWIQGELNMLIGLLLRYILLVNVAKYKAMI